MTATARRLQPRRARGTIAAVATKKRAKLPSAIDMLAWMGELERQAHVPTDGIVGWDVDLEGLPARFRARLARAGYKVRASDADILRAYRIASVTSSALALGLDRHVAKLRDLASIVDDELPKGVQRQLVVARVKAALAAPNRAKACQRLLFQLCAIGPRFSMKERELRQIVGDAEASNPKGGAGKRGPVYVAAQIWQTAYPEDGDPTRQIRTALQTKK